MDRLGQVAEQLPLDRELKVYTYLRNKHFNE
jgi:hypothetical protein